MENQKATFKIGDKVKVWSKNCPGYTALTHRFIGQEAYIVDIYPGGGLPSLRIGHLPRSDWDDIVVYMVSEDKDSISGNFFVATDLSLVSSEAVDEKFKQLFNL